MRVSLESRDIARGLGFDAWLLKETEVADPIDKAVLRRISFLKTFTGPAVLLPRRIVPWSYSTVDPAVKA